MSASQLAYIAAAEIGTQEATESGAMRIRVYQTASWLPPGPWPWCAAFVAWRLKEWLNTPENAQACVSPGFPPQQHELELFAQQPPMSRNPWVLIGQRIGLPALLVVLDELGGDVAYVPTRHRFLWSLWQPLRDEQIRRMHHDRIRVEEIARTFGLSRTGVLRVLRDHGQTCPGAKS